MVVETLDHDQYRIRIDGSGRTTLRNRRFIRPIIPFNNPPSLDRHTDPPSQPSHAGQAVHVQPGEVSHDQHVQHEGRDVQHSPDTVQVTSLDPIPPSQTSAESIQAPPSSSVTPRQSTTTPTTASSEPAARRSGRTRRMNTRLIGYELGSVVWSKRSLVGGGR